MSYASVMPRLYKRLEEKDAETHRAMMPHTFANAIRVWREKHPEDFVTATMSTRLFYIENHVDEFVV